MSEDFKNPNLALSNLAEVVEKRLSVDLLNDAGHREWSSGDDADALDLDQDGLQELLQCKQRELLERDRILCDKDQYIAELQRLLATREAEAAQARADSKKMGAVPAQNAVVQGDAQATRAEAVYPKDSVTGDSLLAVQAIQNQQSMDGFRDCHSANVGGMRDLDSLLDGKLARRSLHRSAVQDGELRRQRRPRRKMDVATEIRSIFQEAIDAVEDFTDRVKRCNTIQPTVNN